MLLFCPCPGIALLNSQVMHCTQAAEAEELSFPLNLVKNKDVDWLEKKLHDLFVLKAVWK